PDDDFVSEVLLSDKDLEPLLEDEPIDEEPEPEEVGFDEEPLEDDPLELATGLGDGAGGLGGGNGGGEDPLEPPPTGELICQLSPKNKFAKA
ncbi:MAG: hypothetical protein K2X66_17930, partial [Cyanobacteria bacterium]|nr:hypothetical protein [Cyanobacteriota bacterium]